MTHREGELCCLVETAFGACGLAWTDEGLTRLQLPMPTRAATEARLGQGRMPHAGDLPSPVKEAAEALAAYFRGEPVDLGFVAVDLGAVPEMDRRIYAALRDVPRGETVTYGELARRIGSPGAARLVGQAMGRNPVPVVIPCHRVLAGGNAWGGFSAPGGRVTKQRLLELEGATDVARLPLFAPRA